MTADNLSTSVIVERVRFDPCRQFGEVCAHGSLARSCETCLLERDVAELKKENAELTAAIESVREWAENFASGYEDAPDVHNESPDDDSAWRAGIIVQICKKVSEGK